MFYGILAPKVPVLLGFRPAPPKKFPIVKHSFYDIILKESIRFRAVKKEQLIQKISCSECDSFQLYQFAETLAVIYMGIVSSPEA